MKSVLSITLTILTVALIALTSFAVSVQAETMAVLPGLKGVFAGTQPDNIGVIDGKLASCPPTPNCVVSQGADEDHAIAPITYTTDLATARQNLLNILGVVPRAQIVQQSDDYILAYSESRLMGFVDDSEFYFPSAESNAENVIQMRSAARLGESDLGVNRRRLEQIRLAFQELEQRAAASEAPD